MSISVFSFQSKRKSFHIVSTPFPMFWVGIGRVRERYKILRYVYYTPNRIYKLKTIVERSLMGCVGSSK